MHINAKKILLGFDFRSRQQVIAVAEPDLHNDRCGAAEDQSEIKGLARGIKA